MEEIKTTGLFPLKLGEASIINNKWKLIAQYDLAPIINITQQRYIGNTNETSLSILLQEKEMQIEAYLRQLLTKNSRRKRGLLNVAGSLIKAITGNLDQEDAIKYDHILEQLEKSQENLETIVHKQVTLSKATINEFSKKISSIVKNQESLIKNIETLKLGQEKLANEIQLSSIIYQKLFLTESINDMLLTLVDAVTFAKLNRLHPSILNYEVFIKDLQNFQQHLNPENKFLFEPSMENIHLFEDVVSVKAYTKASTIIFIIEVPLVLSEKFDYYQLFPLPIKNENNEFYFLKPENTYLAISKQNFVTQSTPCREVTTNRYLCETSYIQDISNSSPCEVQLISYSQKYDNCYHYKQNLTKPWINKIQKNSWLLIVPSEQRLVKKCKNEEITNIIGTWIVSIPAGCFVSIAQHTLTSYTEGNLPTRIKLPNLEFSNKKTKTTNINIKFQNFTPIYEGNLDKLTENLFNIENDLSILQTQQGYYHPLSKWIILVYICIIVGFATLSTIAIPKWMHSRRTVDHQLPTEDGQQPWIP